MNYPGEYNSTDLMPRVYEAMFQMAKRARYFNLPLGEYRFFMPVELKKQLLLFIEDRYKTYIDPNDEDIRFYGIKIVDGPVPQIVLTHPKSAIVRGWPFITLEDIGTPYMDIKWERNDNK